MIFTLRVSTATTSNDVRRLCVSVPVLKGTLSDVVPVALKGLSVQSRRGTTLIDLLSTGGWLSSHKFKRGHINGRFTTCKGWFWEVRSKLVLDRLSGRV